MAAKRWTEQEVAKTNAGKLTKAKAELTKPAAKVDKKPSKYKNEREQVDGIWFDSGKEAEYYRRLKLEKKAGKVSWFVIKPVFHLPGGIKYIADFIVVRDDHLVMGSVVQVVDVKGVETDVFKLKKKLMLEQGIEILLQ